MMMIPRLPASLHARLFALALLLPLLSAAVPAGAADAGSAAYQALEHGRLAEASALLRQQLAANRSDAEAHQLLCRTWIAEEQGDDAVAECLLAVQAGPRDAANQLWLGRAFGLKASNANPIAAYKLAGRVRESFEHAVALDPNNIEAVSELAEFYVAAPSIAGGDIGAATRLANGLLPHAPAKAHRLLGLIAKAQGDTGKAEAEFKQAIAAGNTPEAWSDLGLFYERNHQADQALSAIRQALALDTRHGPVEVDAATILTSAKRAPELAERALRTYLSSPNQTDEAPVPRVHVLLGKLLAQRGDKDGARSAYTAALALAPRYAAAQKALDRL